MARTDTSELKIVPFSGPNPVQSINLFWTISTSTVVEQFCKQARRHRPLLIRGPAQVTTSFLRSPNPLDMIISSYNDAGCNCAWL